MSMSTEILLDANQHSLPFTLFDSFSLDSRSLLSLPLVFTQFSVEYSGEQGKRPQKENACGGSINSSQSASNTMSWLIQIPRGCGAVAAGATPVDAREIK